MQTQKTETPRLGPRIQSWIDAIEPGTPEVTERNNTGKRPRQQKDTNPRPTKRTTRRPLATATGNIMAPPTQPPNRPPIGSPRRSGRIEAKTPQKSTNRGTQANDDVQEEDTPTPGRARLGGVPFLGPQGTYPILAPFAAVDESNARSDGQSLPSRASKSSNDRTESTEEGSVGETSSKAGSSKRSQSPSKKMTDFRMAAKETIVSELDGHTAEKAGGFLSRYRDLISVRSGEGVIPPSFKKLIEKHLHADDWPPMYWYSRAPSTSYDDILAVEVPKIWRGARKCAIQELPEADWNAKVHGPLLELVLANDKYHEAMTCVNTTSARIEPKSLSMVHLSGSKMEKKMVDFAVVLGPNDSRDEQKVRNTIRDMDLGYQTVNQTRLTSLRYNPSYLIAETKLPYTGGPESDVQLCTWASAGLNKLRQMLVDNGQGHEHIPTMPLLAFHGHDVHLSALYEGSVQNKYLGHLYLGSTATIPSMFQLLEALDILCEWGNTEYRAWWFSKVAKAE